MKILILHITFFLLKVHPAVERLMGMGFPEDKVRAALLKAKGSEEAAIEELLSSL